MMRRHLLLAGVALLVACGAWLVRGDADITPPKGIWNQVHHDSRNSGRAPWTTAMINGKCDDWVVYANQTFGQEVIQANGVMSLDGDSIYFIGKAPTYYVIHQVMTQTGEQFQQWTNYFIDLTGEAVGSVAVGPNFLEQGAAGVYYSMGKDVYSLSPEWHFHSPEPVYAPLRLGPQGGMLLVASSNPKADSDGVLHALSTFTGKEVWNFTATEAGQTWGMRISPAVNKDGIVFACFGNTIVALDGANKGKLVSKVNMGALGAVFGSSPTLTEDGSALFLQSKSDDVWRFNISDTVPLTITWDWVCSYQTLVPNCAYNESRIGYNVLDHPERLSDHFRYEFFEKPKATPGRTFAEIDAERRAEAERRGLPQPILPVGDDNRATVALGPGDKTIIFPLYATVANEGGVHSADARTGDRVWRYLSSQDSAQLGDMMGRSSAAVDAAGHVFIGMDQVDQGESGVPPVLLALDSAGNRLWVNGGLQPGPIWTPIGLRSPMLGYASEEDPAQGRVMLARGDALQAFGPGQLCPTTSPLLTCSGHGTCNCNTGTCACELLTCFYGDDCGTTQTCSEHGVCEEGICICTDPCFTGQTCETAVQCSGRGTCQQEKGCVCSNTCFYGDDCEDVRDCSGQGECSMETGVCICHEGATGPNCSQADASRPGGMGAGWVFVIVLLCVSFTATLMYSVYWKRRTGVWWVWKWRVDSLTPGSRYTAGERRPLASSAVPSTKGGALASSGITDVDL